MLVTEPRRCSAGWAIVNGNLLVAYRLGERIVLSFDVCFLVQNILFEKRQEHDIPRRETESNQMSRYNFLVRIFKTMRGKANLFEMVGALVSAGGFSRCLNGREEQSDQNADDCDYDQLLDVGKTAWYKLEAQASEWFAR